MRAWLPRESPCAANVGIGGRVQGFAFFAAVELCGGVGNGVVEALEVAGADFAFVVEFVASALAGELALELLAGGEGGEKRVFQVDRIT